MPIASWPARLREAARASRAARRRSAVPGRADGLRTARVAVHRAVRRRRGPGRADRGGNRARDAHELLRRLSLAGRGGRPDHRGVPRRHADHRRDLHIRAPPDRGRRAPASGPGVRRRLRGLHAAVRRGRAGRRRHRSRLRRPDLARRLPRGALVLRAAGGGDRGCPRNRRAVALGTARPGQLVADLRAGRARQSRHCDPRVPPPGAVHRHSREHRPRRLGNGRLGRHHLDHHPVRGALRHAALLRPPGPPRRLGLGARPPPRQTVEATGPGVLLS
jgi:hypothetical protein